MDPKKLNETSKENQENPEKSGEEDDAEFRKKNANIFFRTTNKSYGGKNSTIKADSKNGIDGRFTYHLLNATMYRNFSLNTTTDKERYIGGSKDWMEHLN